MPEKIRAVCVSGRAAFAANFVRLSWLFGIESRSRRSASEIWIHERFENLVINVSSNGKNSGTLFIENFP